MPNNNLWDLLLKVIVPLSFLAIWAVTSLFNRESKPVPTTRAAGPSPSFGPRPTEPTLRWSPASSPPNQGVRRVPIGNDDILVIRSDSTSRQARPDQVRPSSAGGPRRSAKSKAAAAPGPKLEAVTSRSKLAGVSQNVSQQISKSSLEMAPLTAMPPTATSTTLGLSTSPSAIHQNSVPWVSTLAASLTDPVRLREAFVINEILQPPLTLRGVRSGRR